jgi:hypothetical protein
MSISLRCLLYSDNLVIHAAKIWLLMHGLHATILGLLEIDSAFASRGSIRCAIPAGRSYEFEHGQRNRLA